MQHSETHGTPATPGRSGVPPNALRADISNRPAIRDTASTMIADAPSLPPDEPAGYRAISCQPRHAGMGSEG
jgi:hypothetical protein